MCDMHLLFMSVSNKSLTVVIGRTHLDYVRVQVTEHETEGVTVRASFVRNDGTTQDDKFVAGRHGGWCS